MTSELEQIFRARRHRQRWDTAENNTAQANAAICEAIPVVIEAYAVASMIDAPCGDGAWMRTIDLSYVDYLGVDILPDLIDRNRETWGDGRTFLCRDITDDILPNTDLILCRDCFVHFPNELIWKTLQNFKASRSTYLLTTTFPDHENGKTNAPGPWRAVNLEAPPFNFPKPIELINERYAFDYRYADKSLGLWRLDEIEPTQGG